MSQDVSLEVTVARQGERLDDVEDRFDKHETKQNGSMEKIWKKLDEMARRPTWGVSITITGLCALVTGLVMALLKH